MAKQIRNKEGKAKRTSSARKKSGDLLQKEEEKYFSTAAAEMNKDAKAWNMITTASASCTL